MIANNAKEKSMRGRSSSLFLIIGSLLFFSQTSLAQSPINLSGSVGGGLLFPQSSNLKGAIWSAYDYPLSKTGFDVHGKIRLGLPVLPFTIVGFVSYNALSDDAVLPVATTSGTVNSKYTQSLHIISTGVGVEYCLLPTPIVKPYVSATAVMNFIGGNASYDNDIIAESKMNSTSRLGLDLGVGTSINVPAFPFSVDIEAKYRFANLSGKDFGSSNGANGFGGIPQTTSYDLNDDKNPNDSKDYARSINYFTITLGLNFNIL
jgi:hypothetical protein